MNKKIYKTYKESIYISPSDSIRTNGYYIQLGELHPNVNYRDAIIFYGNGYTTSFWLEENKLQDELKTKITNKSDTLLADLDWWKIKNDSLIIEHYSETKRDWITWNFYERGRIINDTLIELHYDDSPYQPVKFKFIETDSLPKIKNTGRYLKREWYTNGLNESRKTYKY